MKRRRGAWAEEEGIDEDHQQTTLQLHYTTITISNNKPPTRHACAPARDHRAHKSCGHPRNDDCAPILLYRTNTAPIPPAVLNILYAQSIIAHASVRRHPILAGAHEILGIARWGVTLVLAVRSCSVRTRIVRQERTCVISMNSFRGNGACCCGAVARAQVEEDGGGENGRMEKRVRVHCMWIGLTDRARILILAQHCENTKRIPRANLGTAKPLECDRVLCVCAKSVRMDEREPLLFRCSLVWLDSRLNRIVLARTVSIAFRAICLKEHATCTKYVHSKRGWERKLHPVPLFVVCSCTHCARMHTAMPPKDAKVNTSQTKRRRTRKKTHIPSIAF